MAPRPPDDEGENSPHAVPRGKAEPSMQPIQRVIRNTRLDRTLNAIAWGCQVIAGVGLVVLTLIFGWLVYGRYILNATPTWVEQVSLLLVMLITFVGAAVGIHERSHLSVEFFRAALPVPLRRAIAAFCHVILAVFGAVMMVQSAKLAMFKWGALIPLIGVPEGLRAIPITVCGGLIVLFSIGHLIAIARGFDEDAFETD